MLRRTAVFAVLAAVALGAAPSAFAHELTAPNSPSARNEASGATSGLGSSHRFGDIASAQAHCGNSDPVVWSDGNSLGYVLPGSKQYGKATKNYGFYACRSEADDAGFHATGG